jgi:hypothetical protein
MFDLGWVSHAPPPTSKIFLMRSCSCSNVKKFLPFYYILSDIISVVQNVTRSDLKDVNLQ